MMPQPLEKTETKQNQTGSQVLIFPARMPEMEGKRVFYLFSVRQVAEVLSHANVQPVPFGPRYAEGVSEWRGCILPVLSLEQCLGLKASNEQMPLRTIVARSVTKDNLDNQHEMYGIFKVGAAIRQLGFPLACEPTAIPDWVTDGSCLYGVYKMQASLLMVVNIEKILNPKIFEN